MGQKAIRVDDYDRDAQKNRFRFMMIFVTVVFVLLSVRLADLQLVRGSQLEKMGTNINYILPKSEVVKKAEDIAQQISEKNIKSIYLLKYSLSAKKKKLLIDARVHEDFMHKLSFAFPETRKTIEELYAE